MHTASAATQEADLLQKQTKSRHAVAANQRNKLPYQPPLYQTQGTAQQVSTVRTSRRDISIHIYKIRLGYWLLLANATAAATIIIGKASWK
jgi:hypothetical protein